MRSYRLYRAALQMEKYLYLPLHLRATITKFRLSCHSLEIETGRYARPYLPPKEIICRICNVMEDEEHFLLCFPRTQSLPEYGPFLNTCVESIRSFNNLSINNKFVSIMSSQDHMLIYHLGRPLYITFKQRDTLLHCF